MIYTLILLLFSQASVLQHPRHHHPVRHPKLFVSHPR